MDASKIKSYEGVDLAWVEEVLLGSVGRPWHNSSRRTKMPLSEQTRRLIQIGKRAAKDPEFLAATAHRRQPMPQTLQTPQAPKKSTEK